MHLNHTLPVRAQKNARHGDGRLAVGRSVETSVQSTPYMVTGRLTLSPHSRLELDDQAFAFTRRDAPIPARPTRTNSADAGTGTLPPPEEDEDDEEEDDDDEEVAGAAL